MSLETLASKALDIVRACNIVHAWAHADRGMTKVQAWVHDVWM